jgi:hypothetical protein
MLTEFSVLYIYAFLLYLLRLLLIRDQKLIILSIDRLRFLFTLH